MGIDIAVSTVEDVATAGLLALTVWLLLARRIIGRLFGQRQPPPPGSGQPCAAMNSSTTGAIRSRHLLPLKMP